jgi:two-component system sensor histidine kinase YesM
VNNLKFYNTLRFKLVVISVFLIALPVIAVSLTYSRTVKEIIKNKYTETAIQSVNETGEKIDFILDDIQDFSTVIISNSSFLSMLKDSKSYNQDDFKNILRSFLTLRDDIEVIQLVIDDNYYAIGATKTEKDNLITYSLESSSGQPVWIPTNVDKIEILSGQFNKYYFTLGRRIIDFNTLEDYGFLLIDLDEVILENAYTSLLDDGTENFIVTGSGRIISHSDKDKIGKSIVFEPYANELLNDKSRDNYILYESEGEEKVAIYSSIDDHGWKLVKTVSTQYLYAEINRIQRYLLLGGFVYGLCIILFLVFFSIRYTEPMIRIMGVIKKVEQGNLNVRTNVQSNDEIGQLGSSLNNMISEMQALIDKLVKEEQIKKEVELEALHAQINPHFLYNTLNTIKWMAKIQGNKSVSTAITALIKLLRISTNLGKDMITLEEEIEYVKNYIVIQRLRFNESIIINYRIDESCLEMKVPKLILQPIVENSIIYGLKDEREELTVDICVCKEDTNMEIEISDDGPGIEKEVLKNILNPNTDSNKFSKVGLNNVNQRIKLYCGNDYGLNINTELGKGTKVTITLPQN